ncbi:MAG: hypothetical protein ACOC5T_04885 [Elusimicrobiota bacterium]
MKKIKTKNYRFSWSSNDNYEREEKGLTNDIGAEMDWRYDTNRNELDTQSDEIESHIDSIKEVIDLFVVLANNSISKEDKIRYENLAVKLKKILNYLRSLDK